MFCRKSSRNISIDNRYYNRFIHLEWGLSSNAFTVWCWKLISRPPRDFRRFKRRYCIYIDLFFLSYFYLSCTVWYSCMSCIGYIASCVISDLDALHVIYNFSLFYLLTWKKDFYPYSHDWQQYINKAIILSYGGRYLKLSISQLRLKCISNIYYMVPI